MKTTVLTRRAHCTQSGQSIDKAIDRAADQLEGVLDRGCNPH